jgi:1-acyl-sn-glycerol-3-phosphate acyltransferase
MSRPEDGLKQSYTYDAAMFFWRIITQIFFREIRPRGAFHIPPLGEGPVIFVGAPHNNQVCSSEMSPFLRKLTRS